MWKTKLVYALILLMFFTNCKDVKHIEISKIHDNEYLLQSSSRMDLYLSSGRMQLVDSLVVIVSHEQEDICGIYSVSDEVKEVCRYGKIGGGPTEFIQPLLTGTYGKNFFLNELNKHELVELAVETTSDGVSVREVSRLIAPYKPEKGRLVLADIFFVKLDEEHYVAMNSSENGAFFTLLDASLQPILRFGDSPIAEKVPPMVARNRLGGLLATYQGTMVYAANKLPYLALYQWKDGNMKKNWDKYYYETNYAVSNGDLLFDKEKAVGPLLDLKIDSKYIYVLYMEQLLSEYDYDNTEKSCGNKILVFDYDGHQVASFKLDCRINEMAINREKGWLVGIAQNPDMALVKFAFPKGL